MTELFFYVANAEIAIYCYCYNSYYVDTHTYSFNIAMILYGKLVSIISVLFPTLLLLTADAFSTRRVATTMKASGGSSSKEIYGVPNSGWK